MTKALVGKVLFGITLMVYCVSCMVAQPASASVGSGGGAGGGSGGAQSSYGYGWYKYPLSGSGPGGFRDGGSWQNVKNLCAQDSADIAVMFAVLTSPNGPASRATIYKDNWNASTPTYKTGGDWVSRDTARQMYDSLPASQKVGFTFGGSRGNVAWFCYSTRKQWTVTGQTYIKKGATNATRRQGQNALTARPGETLYWDNEVKNIGPQATDRSVAITMWYWNQRLSPSYTELAEPPARQVAKGSFQGTAPNALIPFQGRSNARQSVLQSDVGYRICEKVYWRPSVWNNASAQSVSNVTCASVSYSYSLVPSITELPDVVMGGGDIINDARVTNPGGSVSPTKSRPSEWRKSLIVVPPSNTDPKYPTTGMGTGNSSSEPCVGTAGGYFGGAGIIECRTIASGTGVVINPSGSIGNADPITISIDYEIGSKICIAMSVKPRSSSSNEWAHAIRCTIAGKKPKVQVWGGDTSVGRGTTGLPTVDSTIHTSLTVKSSGKVFGSWGEYGLFAPATITTMGSASGLSGGNVNTTQGSWSAETFNNTAVTATPPFGKYATSNARLPDSNELFPVESAVQYGSSESSQTWNVANIAGKNVKPIGSAGTINLSAATLNRGQWAVINAPNSTVTIMGDITYANGPFAVPADIPQLIINAKEINIAAGVTRVDAWLVARNGGISTCSDKGTASALSVNYTNAAHRLSAGDCNRQLRINGPVIAKKLFLRRTYGSQISQGGDDSAGEVISLRPDAYMWANYHAMRNSTFRSTHLYELPPRY